MNDYLQRVLIAVDHQNLFASLANIFRRRPDYKILAEYLASQAEGRLLTECAIYIGLPPPVGETAERRKTLDRLVEALRHQHFLVITRQGTVNKINVDGLMMLDTLELASEMRPDIVVLVTGDGDFDNLALRLRRKGMRVEVTKVGDNLSPRLSQAANDVIDLAEIANQFPPIGDADAPVIGTSAVFDDDPAMT